MYFVEPKSKVETDIKYLTAFIDSIRIVRVGEVVFAKRKCRNPNVKKLVDVNVAEVSIDEARQLANHFDVSDINFYKTPSINASFGKKVLGPKTITRKRSVDKNLIPLSHADVHKYFSTTLGVRVATDEQIAVSLKKQEQRVAVRKKPKPEPMVVPPKTLKEACAAITELQGQVKWLMKRETNSPEPYRPMIMGNWPKH